MATANNKSGESSEHRDKTKHGLAAPLHDARPEPVRQYHAKKYSLHSRIINGPVQSRRLGVSLGINLFPTEYKLCSFNCNYCQYGWAKKKRGTPPTDRTDAPSAEEVVSAIAVTLERLSADGKSIDSITICGNGEPTLYPDLAEVIQTTRRLRDQHQPQARLVILSNSSTVGNTAVRAALDLLDIKIMKFDAGSEEIFQQLNYARAPIYMGDIVAGLKELSNIHLQCLFVQGRLTNADPDTVGLWIERVRDIRPVGVEVYTLDPEPSDSKIERVSLTTLQWVADQVRWRAGVPAEVC